MCGIAGFKKQTHPSDKIQMRAMLAAQRHRGPDDEGIWMDETYGVTLGQRRLAIIDLSPGGHQPMLRGPYAITFNGEIYNYQILRRELEKKGFSFTSESDTEVLLKGYEAWGHEVVDRLVGMFAFAIWDATKEELFLARDRAGEKPLYYSQYQGKFAFASELGALTNLPWLPQEINQEAVALYLVYQYIPSPLTIFKNVCKLPPGHAMTVCGDQLKTWRYWDPLDFVKQPRLELSVDEAAEQLEPLLREAVKGQMIADVPLGAFLSGGIDSSAIVALMTELSSQPVKTFTIGFDVPEYNEAEHAAAVAAHLGTDHTCEYLSEQDALELIPGIPGMYGEPFADPSALPTHLVAGVARKHVTVSLSGDGGDEAFGGYDRYDTLERFESYGLPKLGSLKPIAGLVPGKVGRAAALMGMSVADLNLELMRKFSPDEAEQLTSLRPRYATYEDAWNATKGLASRRRATVADMLTYMPEAVLAKVDRAAMAVSLETRAPLLDHRVLEFSLRLPNQLLKGKPVLRELVYKRVPKALLDRPKQGFAVPLDKWFRSDLRDLLYDTLTVDNLDKLGIANSSFIKTMIDKHVSGEKDANFPLWTFLVLVLWHEQRKIPIAA